MATEARWGNDGTGPAGARVTVLTTAEAGPPPYLPGDRVEVVKAYSDGEWAPAIVTYTASMIRGSWHVQARSEEGLHAAGCDRHGRGPHIRRPEGGQ